MWPAFEIRRVDEALHPAAVGVLLGSRRHDLSLVDSVGFALMRIDGIDTALAFDDDFRRAGFRTIPE